MSFLHEFKQFALRGKVMDLAIAVVIGTAFSKIVSSLVDGIIMPVIGLILGGINIASKTIVIGQAVIKWGLVLQSVIDFTMIAFTIFLAIKAISVLRHQKQATEIPLPPEIEILAQIRDLLKTQLESSSGSKP